MIIRRRGGRPSTKMLEVEEEQGKPLAEILPAMITEHGLTATGEYLGVARSTLGYWLMKLNIKTIYIALSPGDKITIERKDSVTVFEHDDIR